MKKPKSDTRITLIISAICILLTGLIIAENLPNATGQEIESRQALMQQVVEQSKAITLESVQDAEPESLSESESESESESPQMDIAEAYDILNQDILEQFSNAYLMFAASMCDEMNEYADKVRGDFEPVPYEGDTFPPELIMMVEEGMHDFFYGALDGLEQDELRLDADEMYKLFPELEGHRNQIQTEWDAYNLVVGTARTPGIYHIDIDTVDCYSIYHLDKAIDEDYYIFVYQNSGNDRMSNVQLARRTGNEFIKEDEFEVQTFFDSGGLFRYEDNYYYAYYHTNNNLKFCTDGIEIHKLGTDGEEQGILIRYLPDTYAWQNSYCNEKFDPKLHEELEEYLDSIKPDITSNIFLEKGQEKHPGIYYGDETEAQDFRLENNEKYYKIDLANIGIPVYMTKESSFDPYGWYVSTEFYLYNEKQDTLMELENLGSDWYDNTLVQIWFKEIDGNVLTFRIFQHEDFRYTMSVTLVEGDQTTVVRKDFLVPEKSRFALTEG